MAHRAPPNSAPDVITWTLKTLLGVVIAIVLVLVVITVLFGASGSPAPA